jgi:hypothetical protein
MAGERQHLVLEIRIVLPVAPRPVRWMQVASVPALGVDAVDAVQLEPPTLDILAEHRDHPSILPFVEPPHRCRENEDPRTGVPEDEKVHLAPE